MLIRLQNNTCVFNFTVKNCVTLCNNVGGMADIDMTDLTDIINVTLQ